MAILLNLVKDMTGVGVTFENIFKYLTELSKRQLGDVLIGHSHV